MCQDQLELCGLWRFQPDPYAEGEAAGYFKPGYDCRRWREVSIPSCFEAGCPGLDFYEGIGWFARRVIVPESWRGKRVLLRFEAVNYHAKVWVNGREAGEHRDPFLPFEFAVQDLVEFGTENVITVRADNERLAGEVPGEQRGWRTFGGILREVTFSATDLLYVDHISTIAEPPGKLLLRIMVKNERAEAVKAELQVKVLDREGNTLASLPPSLLTPGAGVEKEVTLETQVEGVESWSPATPELYTAKVELLVSGQPLEKRQVRFGFRKIEAHDDKLLLNGEPIFLTGFNRHEDSPQRDMATDLETARQDLLEMKDAGANFVRLCHYPHHPGELDLCDELGLLVMDEIPLYWWTGDAEGKENCARKLAAATRQLEKLIRRDRNHPSIIFWSASNENGEGRSEVAEGNRKLVRAAKELDPTRLAVHVSDHWREHPNFGEDDAICVNAYPSLSQRREHGHNWDLTAATHFWREALETLHAKYPGKPILISEFGYCSFEGTCGGAFGEDVQARAIEAEFAGMDAPYICGTTIWCWADHPWPGGTDFCRGVTISPYGVLSRDRRKLAAYWTARQLFRQKQGLTDQPKPVPSEPPPAGEEVTMIRPDLLNIPDAPFPEGFGIRPMRLDDAGLWTDIWRDAEPYSKITDDLFAREFGQDPQAIQRRCFIVTNDKGCGVGTISAWYHRDFKGEDYGRIHWVATRPAYQRRGLAKAALAYALKQLARWHQHGCLGTQTNRLPAIKLYLDFGFLPDLETAGAAAAWRQVKARLPHPALEKLSL